MRPPPRQSQLSKHHQPDGSRTQRPAGREPQVPNPAVGFLGLPHHLQVPLSGRFLPLKLPKIALNRYT
jgi:hypothetical protein